MRRYDGTVLLSATDLMGFMGCAHATQLDLRYLNGDKSLQPCADSEDAALLQAKGDAHEHTHASLRTLETGSVCPICSLPRNLQLDAKKMTCFQLDFHIH